MSLPRDLGGWYQRLIYNVTDNMRLVLTVGRPVQLKEVIVVVDKHVLVFLVAWDETVGLGGHGGDWNQTHCSDWLFMPCFPHLFIQTPFVPSPHKLTRKINIEVWLKACGICVGVREQSPNADMISGGFTLHLHLSHLADALIQSDLQIGAFTLW
jgi:hypothetical protein